MSKYRTLGLVGEGQFGRVFCGVVRKTGELVALKEVDQRFPTKKFLRELRFLVMLNHPNIVTCQGLEHHQNKRYLVMDYCEGGTLRDLLVKELSIVAKLKLISDILQGIEYAHNKDVIHRDLKPENILLNLTATGWNARISDFGVAKLMEEIDLPLSTSLGDTGSPAYMAPEQFYGKYSPASDIYAIGIILFELLVGERPFIGTPNELMLAHLNQPVEIPSTVPFLLRSAIITALQKLPQRRFASGTEMLKSIKNAAEVLGIIYKSPLLLTQAKITSTPTIVTQKYLAASVNLMIVMADDIYLSMGHVISCYHLGTEFREEWQVKLQNEVIELNPHPSGCFAQTNTALYWLGGAVIFQIVQSKKLLTAIEPGGNWLAFAGQINKSKFTGGIINFPVLNQINQEIEAPFPSQLIILDQRHGLAILPTENGTRFQIFNRRGVWLESFFLPIPLKLVTGNLSEPFTIFAVEKNYPGFGLLINLRPFKVTRFALEISPDFVVENNGGYVLAESQGKVLTINSRGEGDRLYEVPGKITAIAPMANNHILIATSSNNQNYLLKIDLN